MCLQSSLLVKAQRSNLFDLQMPPSIYTSNTFMPVGTTEDSLYSFASNRYLLGCWIPLKNNLSYYEQDKWDTASSIFAIHSSARFNDLYFSRLANNHDILNASIGFTYIFKDRKKTSWLFDGGLILNNDITNKVKTNEVLYLMGLYSIKSNKKVTWNLGLLNIKTRNAFLPIPIIGLRYQFTDDDVLQFYLPFNFSLAHNVNKNTLVRFLLQPNGNVSLLSNEEAFNTSAVSVSRLAFVYSEMQLGMQLEAGKEKKLGYTIGGGILGGRNIYMVADKVNNHYPLNPSLYLRVGVRVSLAGKKEGTQQKQMFFNDPLDPGQFEIDDLEKIILEENIKIE
ncbi:MAG: hypothetical protein HJHJAOHD_01782 [Flavobacteriales bacterium]|nr:hypothetical protein [Flavobacteriales bacterium]